MMTGLDLALRIVAPMAKELLGGMGGEQKEWLDKYTAGLALAMDKLQPVFRAAVASKLQEEMEAIANNEDRADYMKQVRAEQEGLRVEAEQERRRMEAEGHE